MEIKLQEELPKLKKQAISAPVVGQNFDIPELIEELKKRAGLPRIALISMIIEATNVLKIQSTLIKIDSPLVIVGDIHGQFYDLINLFERFGFPPKTNYLFLGDYVDRGKFCIEVITLIMALKINYPKNIYLLRGNHEGRVMTSSFNFKTECEVKYHNGIYEMFIDFFKNLPLCALVDKRYFAVHAGISPYCQKIKDIETINRFVQIPEQGAVCDLLWSDPVDQNNEKWKTNKNRSCSFFYSRNQSADFLTGNHLGMIIRGHQVQMTGYKYQLGKKNQTLTLTIFSAPRYCDTYRNKGAVAILNKRSLSIQSFKEVQHPFVMGNYLNAFQLSFSVMAASVTRIFSYLLKSKKMKKNCKASDKITANDLNKVVSEVQVINQMLSKQVQNLLEMVLLSSQTAEGLVHIDQNVCESLLQLFELECKRNPKKKTDIFGPQKLQFIRVKASSSKQEDPQVQC